MRIKVALAQINTKLGRVEENLEKHLEFIEAAEQRGAGLVVFPELSLTGYVLQDLASTVSISVSKPSAILEKLQEASQRIDILFGMVEEDLRNRFFISSVYLSQGEICIFIAKFIYQPMVCLMKVGFRMGRQYKGV